MNLRIWLASIFVIWSSAGFSAETIAVIPKGTTHEFWKSVHAGAVKAGRELGVEIIWKGPQREDDREQQIQVVEDFVSRKVSGIVLAPLDDKALAGPVRDAKKANIPTVVIDSDLQGNEHVSFVATDNLQGGILAGERLGKILGGKGKVMLLRYVEGSASNTNREEGFLKAIKEKFPKIEVVSSNQFSGATVEGAYQKGEDLLNRYPNVDGIFCPNGPVTFGMLRALTDAGKAGKVKFVGFDATERLIEAVRKGEIDSLVVQDPINIGELGVKTMVAHLRGQKVEKIVRTRLELVTKDNLDTPEIKELISPDLSKYLDK
ncbi:substrate-binding domain-containing protein [Candidatus Sumerlaeota bacterium]|nr:substrate-binding domain-containing protein [Candidatus Sumerlaeota bacterium]